MAQGSHHIRAEFVWSSRQSTYIQPDPSQTSTTLLPEPSYLHAGCKCDPSTLCIFGGTSGRSTNSTAQNRSDSLARINNAICVPTTTTIQRYVYDMRGHQFHKPRIEGVEKRKGRVKETLLPAGRFGHTLVSDMVDENDPQYTGNMYLYGGVSGDAGKWDTDVWSLVNQSEEVDQLRTRTGPLTCCQQHNQGTRSVHEMCDLKFKWQKLKIAGGETSQNPGYRKYHLSCVHGDSLYVIGGLRPNNKPHTDRSGRCDVWKLNFKLKDSSGQLRWDKVKISGTDKGPKNTSLISGQLIGNNLYCVEISKNKQMHSLEIKEDSVKWHTLEIKGKTHPIPRHQHSTCLIGGVGKGQQQILVCGGSARSEDGEETSRPRPLNDVHLLSVNKQKLHWIEIEADKGHVPYPRFGHTVASHQTSVFMFGGQTSNNITRDMSILIHQKWRELASSGEIPSPRIGASSTMMGTLVFVVGGAVNGRATNDVFVYDTVKSEWKNPSMFGLPPPALVGHCTATVGEEVFVFGGGDGTNPNNDLFVIDTSTKASNQSGTGTVQIKYSDQELKRKEAQELEQILVRLSAGTFNHKSTSNMSEEQMREEIKRQTKSHGKWRWVKPNITGRMPEGGVGATMISYANNIYVYSGFGSRHYTPDVAILNTSTMTWTHPEQKGGKLPLARVGHTSTLLRDDEMVVFGGSHQGKHLHDTWVMSLGGGTSAVTWTNLKNQGKKPSARFGHTATAVGKYVYVVGGATKFDGSEDKKGEAKLGLKYRESVDDHVYVMDPRRQQRVATWTRPVLGHHLPDARYRGIGAHMDGMLYLLGGSHGSGQLLWGLDTGNWEAKVVKAGASTLLQGPGGEGQGQNTGKSKDKKAEGEEDIDDEFKPLAQFLDKHQLSKYFRTFKKQDCDWELLQVCNDHDLIQVGIKALGPRKKILKELSKLASKAKLMDSNSSMSSQAQQGKRRLFEGKYEILSDPPEYNGRNKPITLEALDIRTATHRRVMIKFVNDRDAWAKEVGYLRSLRHSEGYVVELLDYEGRDKKIQQKNIRKINEGKLGADEAELDMDELNDQGEGGVDVKFIPGTDKPIDDLYEPFTLPKWHWMALEHAESTLRSHFQQAGIISELERKALFERILLILAHLHSHTTSQPNAKKGRKKTGVVHWDLKPENMGFFGRTRRLKIFDFGSAVIKGDDVPPESTPKYCSPEVAEKYLEAQKKVTACTIEAHPSVDVWSAGMILMEMYLGKPVLQDYDDERKELSEGDDFIDKLPWYVVKSSNVQAERVLRAMLQEIPQDRPSAKALLEDPYVTSGLDDEQIDKSFGPLQRQNKEISSRLAEVESDAAGLIDGPL